MYPVIIYIFYSGQNLKKIKWSTSLVNGILRRDQPARKTAFISEAPVRHFPLSIHKQIFQIRTERTETFKKCRVPAP